MAHVRTEEGLKGELVKARIYTGRASQERDRRTYAANRRQFAAWQESDERIEVIARTLDYKLGKPREKGVDVQIAIDLVRTTLFDDEHDVAVLVSADTDLLPALELIARRKGPDAIEVATWSGSYWSPKPLSIAGHRIRQHKMSEEYSRAAFRHPAPDRALGRVVSVALNQRELWAWLLTRSGWSLPRSLAHRSSASRLISGSITCSNHGVYSWSSARVVTGLS